VSNFKGFAELRAPRDLVKKLEYDLARVLKSPQDQYAAFDFFVTAEHIVDWIHPDYYKDKKRRTEIRSSTPILRITSHIANGVKHFEAKWKQHDSVQTVEFTGYVMPDYVEKDYVEDHLIVHLTETEQGSFGKSSVKVTDLAKQVYDYWNANTPQAYPDS